MQKWLVDSPPRSTTAQRFTAGDNGHCSSAWNVGSARNMDTKRTATTLKRLEIMVPQLNNVFQIAYATNDVEQAATLLRERFGTGAVTILDPPGDLMRIGLAFAGRTMFELIQPINDPVGLYSNWIAHIEGFALRHHHLGILVESREQLASIRQAHVDNGTAVATEGSLPDALDFLYVDTTPQLGHYLEYVRLDAGGRAMFANIEGSIFEAA